MSYYEVSFWGVKLGNDWEPSLVEPVKSKSSLWLTKYVVKQYDPETQSKVQALSSMYRNYKKEHDLSVSVT